MPSIHTIGIEFFMFDEDNVLLSSLWDCSSCLQMHQIYLTTDVAAELP